MQSLEDTQVGTFRKNTLGINTLWKNFRFVKKKSDFLREKIDFWKNIRFLEFFGFLEKFRIFKEKLDFWKKKNGFLERKKLGFVEKFRIFGKI